MRHKQGMADVPYREILYWQILHFVYPYNVVKRDKEDLENFSVD